MTQQAAAKPGWYGQNYWDGQAWVPGAVKPPPRPESPWGWVCGGVGLAIVGMFVVYVGIDGDAGLIALIGYLLAAFGSFMTMIGVIALGVLLGGQHLDYERRRSSP